MIAHVHSVTKERPGCCRVCSHMGRDYCAAFYNLYAKSSRTISESDTCPPSWCPLPVGDKHEAEIAALKARADEAERNLRVALADSADGRDADREEIAALKAEVERLRGLMERIVHPDNATASLVVIKANIRAALKEGE